MHFLYKISLKIIIHSEYFRDLQNLIIIVLNRKRQQNR